MLEGVSLMLVMLGTFLGQTFAGMIIRDKAIEETMADGQTNR